MVTQVIAHGELKFILSLPKETVKRFILRLGYFGSAQHRSQNERCH
jgi:hypothetical protein